MLSTDKQTDKQTDKLTNQRYQKHNLLCQGGNKCALSCMGMTMVHVVSVQRWKASLYQ